MVFALPSFPGLEGNELSASRGRHDVALSGPSLQLLALCPEIDAAAPSGDDGTRALPYWMAVRLSLQLATSNAPLDAWNAHPVWRFGFDPRALWPGLL